MSRISHNCLMSVGVSADIGISEYRCSVVTGDGRRQGGQGFPMAGRSASDMWRCLTKQHHGVTDECLVRRRAWSGIPRAFHAAYDG